MYYDAETDLFAQKPYDCLSLVPFKAAKGATYGETFATWSPILRRAGAIFVDILGRSDSLRLQITYKQARLLLLSSGRALNEELDMWVERKHPATMEGCDVILTANR